MEDFRKFLNDQKHLSEKSIDNYCRYVSLMAGSYGLSDENKLVETPIKAIEYIGKLLKKPMGLTLESARCYRRALCLLYEYNHNEEFDKILFPKWSAIDVEEFTEAGKKAVGRNKCDG